MRLILPLMLMLAAGVAQGAGREALLEKYQTAIQAGRLEAAEKAARALLAEAEATSGPRSKEAADALSMIGRAMEPKNPEATRYLRASIDLKSSLLGAAHPEVLADWFNYGLALQKGGRGQDALAAFEQCIALAGAPRPADAAYPEPNPRSVTGLTLRALDRMLVTLAEAGDAKAARPIAERALALRESSLGADAEATRGSRRLLASILVRLGDYAAALPLHEAMLAAAEKDSGADSLEYAKALGDVAGDHYGMGDLARCRPELARALAIRSAHLKASDPLVAKVRDDLAKVDAELAAKPPAGG